MLTAQKLEKIIELEESLRAEYQARLDAQSAEMERLQKKQEEQQATIAKQLAQLTAQSADVGVNKRTEQLNRELNHRCDKLTEEVATQKKRIKELQKSLAEERAEVKALKQYDAAAMKKNLDASKKKLAEKTDANALMQKSLNRYKAENAELQGRIKELEAKLAALEPAGEDAAEEVQDAPAQATA